MLIISSSDACKFNFVKLEVDFSYRWKWFSYIQRVRDTYSNKFRIAYLICTHKVSIYTSRRCVTPSVCLPFKSLHLKRQLDLLYLSYICLIYTDESHIASESHAEIKHINHSNFFDTNIKKKKLISNWIFKWLKGNFFVLFLLALGPILGTGIFSILTYSSKYHAGPSSLLSFLIAAVASCLGGKF